VVADSKRLQVLKAITSQLETITIANGYQHDLDGKVHRGRPDYGNETEKPFVSLFEVRPEENPNRADETVQKDQWIIGVQGAVIADTDHPTDPAHNLLADIKKSLAVVIRPDYPNSRNPEHMFQGLIVDMSVDGGICYCPQESQETAVCVVKLNIQLTENLENPYA
jgi:hypothetical protein